MNWVDHRHRFRVPGSGCRQRKISPNGWVSGRQSTHLRSVLLRRYVGTAPLKASSADECMCRSQRGEPQLLEVRYHHEGEVEEDSMLRDIIPLLKPKIGVGQHRSLM